MLSFKKLLIPAAVAVALLVAACGGSSYSSSSPPASASPSVNQTTSGSNPAVALSTASGSLGRYLTGASGRALYIWVADANSMSSCSGACAAAWPPLTAGALPKVMGGASAANLSLIARSDGTKQVAYKGRPLYYYAGD